ncbi:MAG: AtpZ/AtpI family protein [Phycisphaerales bacterium]|nr:AtpZ/AtpI family protein [Phycisphaerales bacterium]
MALQPPRAPEPTRGSSTLLVRYASIGFELAAAIVGLALVGYWVDYHFGTGRWGLTIGACLGVVGGLYNFIRQAIELTRASEAERKRKKLIEHGDDSSRSP